MLHRILMTTDGSPESEKPLAIARQLAIAQGAEVVLLRVVDEPSYVSGQGEVALTQEVYEQLMQSLDQEAADGLSRLAGVLREAGVATQSVVRHGSTAALLLDYVAEAQPDLVVMATHGRSGLARFAMGSVTDRMVREGSAPVLVTRMSSDPGARLEHALVMLDGSGVAEQALPLTGVLAGKPLRRLTLYRTVGDPGDRSPAATYLEGVAARLAAEGVTTDIKVDLGDPRPNVERAARDVDLVILCTHGRGGLDRLRHGSVAEFVMRSVDTPALLVRARE